MPRSPAPAAGGMSRWVTDFASRCPFGIGKRPGIFCSHVELVRAASNLRYPLSIDLARAEALVGQLEKSPERVQLYHGHVNKLIARTMNEIYPLSLTPADSDRKMRLVALEYRARSVLERWRKRDVN